MAAQGANQDKTHYTNNSSKLRKSDQSNFNSSPENIFYPASGQFSSTNVSYNTKLSKHRSESSSRSRSRSPSPTESKSAIVYITDLAFINKNDFELADLIRHRINAMLRIKLIGIQCYSKLGVGFIRVEKNEIKEYLINDVGWIGLDSKDGSSKIIFSEKLELISYIVLELTNEKDAANLPKPDEVIARWIEVSKGEKPHSCDQVNIQFPNIYRIVVTSLDESILTVQHEDFAIKNQIARIYLGADCSYFEDLPRSITENQIREAICKQIGLENISPLSLHIELNKQANNACVIACDTARKWAKKSSLDLENKSISKKENLTCRLLLRRIPESYNIDTIVNHKTFNNKAKIIKYRGENLILEISDKNIFDYYVRIGALRINDSTSLIMENYTPFSDPEEREIDSYTWYESEMFRYKPDIIQFVRNPDHEIFHFKWNSHLWLEQFKRFSSHDQSASKHVNARNFKNISPDVIRHQLQVTVMLNTIATIRKKSYIIGNRTIELNLEKNLQTIIYNHQSKLQRGGPTPLKETPYKKTEIKVINEDCLVIYERLVLEGKKPMLLNMANATSPGGGYRKGDGAQ
ncbi:unnamed protein product [Rotaria sordida]|uniref:Microbial-type PARG catalytic domain-containing protein n=1 Tax=Rotaria sordida TaxID=392033 RepID=A0A814C8H6_9BILA|nr:unnamed protein product [Rotaria sordida]CAF4087288.1 unnamed protein product [Rotaria sordida]